MTTSSDPVAYREVPVRELRNNVSEVLRQVEAGTRIRVTVRGRPVAELVPISGKPVFAPRSTLERILREAPLDKDFLKDVRGWLRESTTDEL